MIGMTFVALVSLLLQDPSAHPEADPGTAAEAKTAVGATIAAPRKTRGVAPDWPERARRVGLNGVVILECRIGPTGKVTGVKVLRGYRILGEAASKAVAKWRYTPTLLDGKPTEVIMTVVVNFALPIEPDRDELVKGLQDDDPEIRWAAVRWLGRYRPVTARQRAALERALNDSADSVRTEAERALARIAEEK